MLKDKIAYVGISCTMVNFLFQEASIELVAVFSDANRNTYQLQDFCYKHGIEFIRVVCDRDILNVQLKERPNYFLMYDTGIIIHQELLLQYDFYNFHPGDLQTNRGRNPLVWNLLSGDEYACLSLHKISETIDEGELIDTYKVKICNDDTIETLSAKLEKGISGLFVSLREYQHGRLQGKHLYGGLYKRKVIPQDYTINLTSDSLETIMRKINSQKTYSGAILPYNSMIYRCTGCDLTDFAKQTSECILTEVGGKNYCFYVSPDATFSSSELGMDVQSEKNRDIAV